MSTVIDLNDIHQVLATAGLKGFTGKYQALGGGEVNSTYRLDFGDRQIILRVAIDEGQRTLENEARALSLMDSPHVPKLIFFDEHTLVKNRLWILESYIPGTTSQRLTAKQFYNLGNLLAQVHKVTSTEATVNLLKQFLDNCKSFGDENTLLNHPDAALRQLIQESYREFEKLQPFYDTIKPTLVHLDVTPSNLLVDGDTVGLIDWEFSKFNDPMSDFPTVYYEDIEYNQGRWRVQIRRDEKEALFKGYESGGGTIDEERIRFWTRFDKLSAAVFLYWRLHESTRNTSKSRMRQYQLDFDNLLTSLKTLRD